MPAPTPAELKAEIDLDPNGLGYGNGVPPYGVANWKGDAVIAGLLNDPTNAQGQGTVERQFVGPREILEQIPMGGLVPNPGDWRALSDADRDYLLCLCGSDQAIDTRAVAGEVRQALLEIFPGGSAARANIVGIVQKTGSRAEVLWGEGIAISASEVGAAANA